MVASALALLVVSVALYATALSGLLPLDMGRTAVLGNAPVDDERTEGAPADGRDQGASGDEADPGAAPTDGDAAGGDLASGDGGEATATGDEDGSAPVDAGGEGSAGTTAPGASGSGSGDAGAAEPPAAPDNGSGGAGGVGPSSGGDVFSSVPSEAEEAEFRAFLAARASAIPGYLRQAEACASDFERDSLSASLSTRRAHLGSCSSLGQQLLSEYAAVVNRPRSNYSAYCDEQERLIGAYRCLGSYVGRYESAWDVNTSYDDPRGHEDEFRRPLGAAAGDLSEFHGYYDGLSL